MLIMVAVSTKTFAGEFVVRGTQKRVELVSRFLMQDGHHVQKLCTSNEVMGRLQNKPWPGVQVVKSGAPASEGIWVPVSNKAVQSKNLCDDQKKLLRSLGIVVTPLAGTEVVKTCQAAGNCHKKRLTGRYQTLRPYHGIRLVSNTGNQQYPENVVTFKVEYHKNGLTGWTYGTGWGPTIILRNVTGQDPISLLDAHQHRIKSYLQKVVALKRGRPGNEGDSCYQVVLLRDGTVYMDESPAEAPFI